MSIGVNGIGEVVMTLQAGDDSIGLGDFVTLSDNGVASKAANDSDPVGVCVSKNGKYIGVQIAGGVTVAQNGTLTRGFSPVKVTAQGLAKATAGKTRLVVSIADNTAAILL